MLCDIPKGYETRMRIVSAMVELGTDKPMTDMAVSDVCRRAGITRQTFYRYFLDKYDAVNWYNEQLIHELACEMGKSLTCDEAGAHMIARTFEERGFYAFTLRTVEDINSLRLASNRKLYESWRDTMGSQPGFPYTERLDFQLRAFSRLAHDMVTEWVLGGCAIPVDEFTDLFTSCIPHEAYQTINDYVLHARRDSASGGGSAQP